MIHRTLIVVVVFALISGAVAAQTVDTPPLDIESHTTPIVPQNADQLELLATKLFPGYSWVDGFASDQSGRVVAAISEHESWITVWDPDTNAMRQFDPLDGLPASDQYEPHARRVTVSPDGTRLAAAAFLQVGEGVLQIWDIDSGSVVYTERMQEPYISNSSALKFSPDGQYLVASIGPHDLAWWDVAAGIRVNTISYRDYDLERTEYDHPPLGTVRDVYITPDNRMFFGIGGAIFEWNLETNASGHKYAMSNAVRLPDALADDARRGFETYPEFPHDDYIFWITVSPDERYIATGLRAGLRIWDTQDPAWELAFEHWDEAIATIAPDVEYVAGLQFSAAGDLLFVVDNDSLFVFSTETWEQLARYDYPFSAVKGLALNESGTLMYVGGVDYGIAVLAVADPNAPPFELPPSTDPGGPCRVEFAELAYSYTLPIPLHEYVYLYPFSPGEDLWLVGRLPDNSWWQDFSGNWISSRDLGPGTIVTGDCEELPIVLVP
ncbi:MAG: hypothetical protein KC547_08695 [Anaerolineae bacterium]|nr:hypothetical protein [Anaerolineae bacterium]